MNKLEHDGFWMSNLLHVFVGRRKAGTNNLLNNYTEKQLMVDVLEFQRVAVECYLHGVNLELESLKLYKMVSVNPNMTPRTWD